MRRDTGQGKQLCIDVSGCRRLPGGGPPRPWKPAKGRCDDRYRTRWACPPEQPGDPERIAIREALAFGKAVYDQSRAPGLSVAGLAGRAATTTGEIGCTEEGGTEPAIALLRRLATTLDAAARLTADTNSVSRGSNPTQPER